MDENKGKAIYFLTEQLHTDVDNIYESMSDDENDEAIENIDLLILKLKELKNNLTIKDEV